MTSQFASIAARLLELAGLRPLNAYSMRRTLSIVLAVSPPIVCASIAESSGNWELFERSGSLTAAIGLIVASRRYIHYGVIELLQAHKKLKSDIAGLLEDIFTAKLGLALSGLGMIISGWGKYSVGGASATFCCGRCLPFGMLVEMPFIYGTARLEQIPVDFTRSLRARSNWKLRGQ